MAGQVTQSRRPPSQQQHEQEQQSRAKWTTSLTRILADLMVDQVRRGNRLNSSFGKKAWKYMCDDFHKKTGLKWDKEQLNNRYGVLRRQYVIVRSLLDQSDFSLDESFGTIIAKDEAWADYIKEHPDAETIKSSGCPIYKQLCMIFSQLATNGIHEQSAEHEVSTPTSVPCPEPLNRCHEEFVSESEEEVDDEADDQDKFQPTTPSTTSSRKRGRKGIDDVIAGAVLEMAAAAKLRTDAVKQCNARYSIANCIKELDEMQGVDEHIYFAALDLFNNRNAREIFLALKGDKRLTWLHGKCTVTSNTLD